MKSTTQRLARRRARRAEILSDRNREARRTVELALQAEPLWHNPRIAELTARLAVFDARHARLAALAARNWAVWNGS